MHAEQILAHLHTDYSHFSLFLQTICPNR
uniref:Uncharacterized protein n=1 Tax=Arundo donax TaxID=35708 RepID=A0A0A9FSA3_ARUDO